MIDRVSIENFKGTTGETFLTQLNIFRGNSGSGKSTWLEAIRVAVVGHDPGYGKLLAETMAFSSGKEMSIEVSNLQVQLKRSFAYTDGKASQAILVNGEKKTAKAAEPLLAEHFGQFPMMLNPDEFFKMSDEKKIEFLFGLSDTETDSAYLRRHCIISILKLYTEAVDYIIEYEFDSKNYFGMDEDIFNRLVKIVIDKVAEKDVTAGRALTKIFSEFLTKTLPNGQETLSLYYNTLKTEINATQRTKKDSEAANRKLMEERTEKMKMVNYDEAENQKDIERLRGEISEIEKDLHARDKVRGAKEMLTSGLAQQQASVIMLSENLSKLEAGLLSKADKKEAVAKIYGYENTNHKVSEQIFIAEVRRIKLEKDYAKKHLISKSLDSSSCASCGETFHCPKCGPNAEEDQVKANKEIQEIAGKIVLAEEYIEKRHTLLEANDKEGLDISSTLSQEANTQEAVEIARKHLKDVIKLVKGQEENLDKMEEPGADDATLKTQLSGLKNTLGERLVAQKNHDWLRTLSATIAKANETINNSKSLLVALKSSLVAIKQIRDELTKSATSTIEEACNELLKKVDPSFNLTYAIEDGKFDIRCIGVEGREVAFKTLSGGEQVLYLSAQLLALMTIVDPKLKILEVEMGELSGNLVPPFMDALEAMTEGKEIQVCLSSCHGDFEVNSDSWTVHQMGEQ